MTSRSNAAACYLAALLFACFAIFEFDPEPDRSFGELLPCLIFFAHGFYYETLWRAGWL